MGIFNILKKKPLTDEDVPAIPNEIGGSMEASDIPQEYTPDPNRRFRSLKSMMEKEEALRSTTEGRPVDITKEDNPTVEPPMFSPDDLIDPSVIGKAGLKAASVGSKAMFPFVSAAIELGRTVGLKATDVAGNALKKIERGISDSGAAGLAAAELEGQSLGNFIKNQINKIKDLGVTTKGMSKSSMQKEFGKDFEGVYIPETKSIYHLLPDEVGEDAVAGIIRHEKKHINDNVPNDLFQNYYTLTTPSKQKNVLDSLRPVVGVEHVDVLSSILKSDEEVFAQQLEKGRLPNGTFDQSWVNKMYANYNDKVVDRIKNTVQDALGRGNIIERSKINQALKSSHFSDPKILDYEQDIVLDMIAKLSADTLTEQEIKVLKEINPNAFKKALKATKKLTTGPEAVAAFNSLNKLKKK